MINRVPKRYFYAPFAPNEKNFVYLHSLSGRISTSFIGCRAVAQANASENVDFALRMMRRSHITPILASRDLNVTSALLKRKFHKGVKEEFPSMTDRVAYSEAELDKIG